jgi:NAD(P)H dehydrogenase (quinone)
VSDDVLGYVKVTQSVLDRARGPLRRLPVKLWIGERDARAIVRRIRGLGSPRHLQPC